MMRCVITQAHVHAIYIIVLERCSEGCLPLALCRMLIPKVGIPPISTVRETVGLTAHVGGQEVTKDFCGVAVLDQVFSVRPGDQRALVFCFFKKSIV